MRYLSKLFNTTQYRNDESYRGTLERFTRDAAELQMKMDSWLGSEAAALQQAGLPVPQQLTSLSHNILPRKDNTDTSINYTIAWPSFNIPRHLSVKVTKDITYTVAETQKGFAEAQQVHAESGLTAMIQYTDGAWTDRDPYAVYKIINRRHSGSLLDYLYTGRLEGLFLKLLGEGFDRPLQIRGELSSQELRYIELTRPLISILTDGKYDEKFTLDPLAEGEILFYCHSLVERFAPTNFLPLFTPSDDPLHSSAGQQSLKILPAPATRPDLMSQFYEGLKQINRPLIFAIIARHGTISFELRYDEKDALLIKYQLDVYFPDYSFLPQPEEPAYHLTHMIYAREARAYAPLKTLNEFTLDPYSQLCKIMTLQPPEAHTRVEIFFSPIPEDTQKRLAEYFKLVSPFDADWVSQAEKKAAKKSPGWMVGLRLHSSEPQVLTLLKERVLSLYKSQEQSWLLSNTPHMMPWNFMSTDELTALAHFPSKDLGCDILETANRKPNKPPSSFIVE